MHGSRVLAVIATLLLAGCSKDPDMAALVGKSFKSMRENVRRETVDPARADSMTALIDSVEQRSLAMVLAVRQENERIGRMFADRSVDDAALLDRFRESERHRAGLRRELLEARERLKSMATPEEWSAISDAEGKAMTELAALSRAK